MARRAMLIVVAALLCGASLASSFDPQVAHLAASAVTVNEPLFDEDTLPTEPSQLPAVDAAAFTKLLWGSAVASENVARKEAEQFPPADPTPAEWTEGSGFDSRGSSAAVAQDHDHTTFGDLVAFLMTHETADTQQQQAQAPTDSGDDDTIGAVTLALQPFQLLDPVGSVRNNKDFPETQASEASASYDYSDDDSNTHVVMYVGGDNSAQSMLHALHDIMSVLLGGAATQAMQAVEAVEAQQQAALADLVHTGVLPGTNGLPPPLLMQGMPFQRPSRMMHPGMPMPQDAMMHHDTMPMPLSLRMRMLGPGPEMLPTTQPGFVFHTPIVMSVEFGSDEYEELDSEAEVEIERSPQGLAGLLLLIALTSATIAMMVAFVHSWTALRSSMTIVPMVRDSIAKDLVVPLLPSTPVKEYMNVLHKH